MHYIISSIILIWILYKANQTINRRQYIPAAVSEKDYKKQQAEIEKAEKQKEKEMQQAKKQQEKEMQQAKKEKQQAEKNRQRKEQAEADKEFLIKQIDRVVEILTALDAESARIDRKIQDDIDGRYYDAEIRHRKQKETIARKIIAAENKLHALETKLAKAKYITQAE